ncbi:MAG: LysR substrate-binding domain-containing protein, partial [Pseudomonadota bacterium]
MADRRLQVFHTVARLLSFTKAAEALHMSQPAVTFQIRQIEEYFNTRLFDRTHNKISLTEAGRQVYEYAEQIFKLYNELENSVRKMTGEVRGILTFGASTTIADYMLPSLLGDFNKRYPDVAIRLRVSNTEGIVAMVENNTIDLGVVEAPVSNKNLVVQTCRIDQLVAIVPPDHPLAGKRTVSLNDLLTEPFICREEGSGTNFVVVVRARRVMCASTFSWWQRWLTRSRFGIRRRCAANASSALPRRGCSIWGISMAFCCWRSRRGMHDVS